MANLRAFSSNNLRRILTVGRCRSCAWNDTLYGAPDIMKPTMHGSTLSMGKWFSTKGDKRMHSKSRVNMEHDNTKDKRVSLVAQSTSKSSFPTWLRWILGAILSSFLPFWKKKWERLLRIQDEVEEVAEVVENVAEVVETVAGITESVSTAVAGKLPEDGTLKDAALSVKSVSKEVIKDAHLTKDFIHKVNELKQEVVEMVVEPIIDPGKLLDNDHEE